ncbi:unnamed protein product [Parajaminaea phylloscopi]
MWATELMPCAGRDAPRGSCAEVRLGPTTRRLESLLLASLTPAPSQHLSVDTVLLAVCSARTSRDPRQSETGETNASR